MSVAGVLARSFDTLNLPSLDVVGHSVMAHEVEEVITISSRHRSHSHRLQQPDRLITVCEVVVKAIIIPLWVEAVRRWF